MRVRYQMYGSDVQARCDMTPVLAKRFFKDLRHDGLCKWAELVGEDDDDYMEVLDSFDKTKLAVSMGDLMKELGVLSW